MPNARGTIARVKYGNESDIWIYVGRNLGSGWYSACVFCERHAKVLNDTFEPVFLKVRGKYHKDLLQDEYGFEYEECYWTFEHKNHGQMLYLSPNTIPINVTEAAQELGLLEA